MPPMCPYLEYLNRLNNSKYQMSAIQQLSDGLFLHEIVSSLKEFNGQYPYEIIAEPLTFIHRMKNIKSVIKAIHWFWSHHVKQEVCYEIDAIKIAKQKSVKEMQKLIRLLVKTLFQSMDKRKFIEIVLQTSQDTQQFFMDLVKQQTSLQFTSPKSSKTNKHNNYNESIYDKFLQLQHQNEHLLRLVQEMASQGYEHYMKQRQLQERINQKQTQIGRLNWMLNEVSEKRYCSKDDIDLSGSREIFIGEMISERVKELEERQKGLLIDVEKMRDEINCKSLQLQKFIQIEVQVEKLKEQNISMKIQLHNTQKQMNELKQRLNQSQMQRRRENEQLGNKSLQVTNLRQQLNRVKQQISQKTEQIFELQTNIRHFQQQKQQFFIFKRTGSSIKQDCQQIANPPVIVRKKRQTDKVNKQLRSALIRIQKQQKQIQRLLMYEQQNKKLVQMVQHMQGYRGEQNQVLVQCLYKLRMKLMMKQEEGSKEMSGRDGKIIPTKLGVGKRRVLGEINVNNKE